MRQLKIICNNVKAGVLTETDDRQYIFVYDTDYVNSSNPSVSLTLPKRKEQFLSAYLFPFFSNLLPEGANKRYICRRERIDENDYMGLLASFAGKDFIGNIGVDKV